MRDCKPFEFGCIQVEWFRLHSSSSVCYCAFSCLPLFSITSLQSGCDQGRSINMPCNLSQFFFIIKSNHQFADASYIIYHFSVCLFPPCLSIPIRMERFNKSHHYKHILPSRHWLGIYSTFYSKLLILIASGNLACWRGPKYTRVMNGTSLLFVQPNHVPKKNISKKKDPLPVDSKKRAVNTWNIHNGDM